MEDLPDAVLRHIFLRVCELPHDDLTTKGQMVDDPAESATLFHLSIARTLLSSGLVCRAWHAVALGPLFAGEWISLWNCLVAQTLLLRSNGEVRSSRINSKIRARMADIAGVSGSDDDAPATVAGLDGPEEVWELVSKLVACVRIYGAAAETARRGCFGPKSAGRKGKKEKRCFPLISCPTGKEKETKGSSAMFEGLENGLRRSHSGGMFQGGCVVRGHHRVGKTAMLLSWMLGEFEEPRSGGVDNTLCQVMFRDKFPLAMAFWDLWPHQMLPFRASDYRMDVALVCFRCGYEQTYQAVWNKWLPELAYFLPTAVVAVVGLQDDDTNRSSIDGRVGDWDVTPAEIAERAASGGFSQVRLVGKISALDRKASFPAFLADLAALGRLRELDLAPYTGESGDNTQLQSLGRSSAGDKSDSCIVQ
jgi:Ras family